MKIIKGIILSLLVFISVATVMSSSETREALVHRPLKWADYTYPIFLIAAVFFLQELFLRFVVPLQLFTVEEKKEVLSQARQYYSKGFFAGTIGMGYFFIALYVFDYFDFLLPSHDIVKAPPNFVLAGIFFIAVGITVKIKGILIFLAKHKGNLATG